MAVAEQVVLAAADVVAGGAAAGQGGTSCLASGGKMGYATSA